MLRVIRSTYSSELITYQWFQLRSPLSGKIAIRPFFHNEWGTCITRFPIYLGTGLVCMYCNIQSSCTYQNLANFKGRQFPVCVVMYRHAVESNSCSKEIAS